MPQPGSDRGHHQQMALGQTHPVSPSTSTTAHQRLSLDSLQRTPPLESRSPTSPKRKPLPVAPGLPRQLEFRLHEAPASPVSISPPRHGIRAPETASIRQSSIGSSYFPPPDSPPTLVIRSRPESGFARASAEWPFSNYSSQPAGREATPPATGDDDAFAHDQVPSLQYHAFDDAPRKQAVTVPSVASSNSESGDRQLTHRVSHGQLGVPRPPSRPQSAYTLGSDLRGRTLSPHNDSDRGSPRSYARDLSSSRRSPSSRPISYVDLLNNLPYHQQIAPTPGLLNNASLQTAVGSAASLLNTKKTLDMYRANVKKTNDPAVQYEFAVFMVNAAKDISPDDGMDPAELVTEARHILHRISDRAYPFAQYYLADGYFSGLFNKGKPDYDKAFPLFVAASKHGHAEAGYRAALCYEFGWGTAKAMPKAVQFYRNSASKNHPGAATRLGLACIQAHLGLGRDRATYRDGVKWLKRAQESADHQYNAGPYELGLMHLTGDGRDVFKDEAYAAQLLTQSAELGHAEANFLMGRAYETGLYSCPRDAALSVHFYNGAASRGHVDGMMALCAWYMVGAPPVLEKDEAEAYAWAREAAQKGYAKAEYAIGYFTEMGIGCRSDPLEANVWYVRAAGQGNETAKQRLDIIRAAAMGGDTGIPMTKADAKRKELGGKEKKKFMGIFS